MSSFGKLRFTGLCPSQAGSERHLNGRIPFRDYSEEGVLGNFTYCSVMSNACSWPQNKDSNSTERYEGERKVPSSFKQIPASRFGQ